MRARDSGGEPDAVMMLIGNKRDLVLESPSFRAVAFEIVRILASSNGRLYMEISAVTGTCVSEALLIHQRSSTAHSAFAT